MIEIYFPVIQFMDGDKYMSSVKKEFLSDKIYLNTKTKYNSNFEIIDSNGNCYLIKNLHPYKFSLIDSIKIVGVIYKMKPEYEFLKTITLDTLKHRVYEHVAKNKSFWSPIDDGRGLKKMIFDAKDFYELIMLFV